MVFNIKHKDLPFQVVGESVIYPNGQKEPLNGTHLSVVQVFLMTQILAELKKQNEPPEPPQQATKTK